MFKIIHIITGLSTGGAERALLNLLSGSHDKRFNFHVISLIDEGMLGPEIKKLGVPVSVLGMRNGRPTARSVNKLRKIINEYQPDVVHGWMYHGNLLATLACKMAAKKPALIWSVRHSLYDLSDEKFMTQLVIRLNSFFSSGAEALLYNSELSKKQHEKFGFSSIHSQVIPNGINVEKFSYSTQCNKEIREELGIPNDAIVIGHVARWHPMKDHSLLLIVSCEIIKSYPEVHFILSGRDVSLENKELRSLMPAEISDRFHFLGERTDVPSLMSSMNIFCLSSWSEAFPNVIGEAMASSLPCIATDVGDSKSIIGDAGIVVPARSVKDMFDGISSLLNMSMQDRLALGVKARARIEENYTLHEMVKKNTALYERLIAARVSV